MTYLNLTDLLSAVYLNVYCVIILRVPMYFTPQPFQLDFQYLLQKTTFSSFHAFNTYLINFYFDLGNALQSKVDFINQTIATFLTLCDLVRPFP